ncbi:hypothetical protein EDC18_1184 [Natranaerovirga pectinivora]|uniref:Uncharacterized protein n=1 Tax=Natranaerovirga pectinivora TaxID=682400 RepID=A0A4R3MIS2_9FIRM|nr:hypothetical protein EDC18_1184 [Natranaerovirga pectinivora]
MVYFKDSKDAEQESKNLYELAKAFVIAINESEEDEEKQ